LGYLQEGLIAVLSGDAITTKLTMGLGVIVLLLAVGLGMVIIAYVLNGQSGYTAGTPTVMLLVLASLGIQALLISMLAYQIENLNLPVRRPVVRVRSRNL
jgi:cytosine/uracil/thiamine/allantoin permease